MHSSHITPACVFLLFPTMRSCTRCAASCRAHRSTRRLRWEITFGRRSRCCTGRSAPTSISAPSSRAKCAPACFATFTTKVIMDFSVGGGAIILICLLASPEGGGDGAHRRPVGSYYAGTKLSQLTGGGCFTNSLQPNSL